mgnify:FL=1
MRPSDVRLDGNPILTSLIMTGVAQAGLAAEKLFPRLPAALRGFSQAQLGDEAARLNVGAHLESAALPSTLPCKCSASVTNWKPLR